MNALLTVSKAPHRVGGVYRDGNLTIGTRRSLLLGHGDFSVWNRRRLSLGPMSETVMQFIGRSRESCVRERLKAPGDGVSPGGSRE